jgi:hypothetical protein
LAFLIKKIRAAKDPNHSSKLEEESENEESQHGSRTCSTIPISISRTPNKEEKRHRQWRRKSCSKYTLISLLNLKSRIYCN